MSKGEKRYWMIEAIGVVLCVAANLMWIWMGWKLWLGMMLYVWSIALFTWNENNK